MLAVELRAGSITANSRSAEHETLPITRAYRESSARSLLVRGQKASPFSLRRQNGKQSARAEVNFPARSSRTSQQQRPACADKKRSRLCFKLNRTSGASIASSSILSEVRAREPPTRGSNRGRRGFGTRAHTRHVAGAATPTSWAARKASRRGIDRLVREDFATLRRLNEAATRINHPSGPQRRLPTLPRGHPDSFPRSTWHRERRYFRSRLILMKPRL